MEMHGLLYIMGGNKHGEINELLSMINYLIQSKNHQSIVDLNTHQSDNIKLVVVFQHRL